MKRLEKNILVYQIKTTPLNWKIYRVRALALNALQLLFFFFFFFFFLLTGFWTDCLKLLSKRFIINYQESVWPRSDSFTVEISTQNTAQSFGQVFVYELHGSGFESSCSHLNFRFGAYFEQGVPWHSGNYRVWIHSEMRTWHDKNNNQWKLEILSNILWMLSHLWMLILLTHLFPMHLFSNPWKHQKILRLSNVFRRCREGALGTNRLRRDFEIFF